MVFPASACAPVVMVRNPPRVGAALRPTGRGQALGLLSAGGSIPTL